MKARPANPLGVRPSDVACNGCVSPAHLPSLPHLESASQCGRGCDMCPTTQACELAEEGGAPIYTPLQYVADAVGLALLMLAGAAGAVYLVITGFNA